MQNNPGRTYADLPEDYKVVYSCKGQTKHGDDIFNDDVTLEVKKDNVALPIAKEGEGEPTDGNTTVTVPKSSGKDEVVPITLIVKDETTYYITDELSLYFDVTPPVLISQKDDTVSSLSTTTAKVKIELENTETNSITYKLTCTTPAESNTGHVANIPLNETGTFELTGLNPNTAYTFQAIATDAAGNESKPVQVSFTTQKLKLQGAVTIKGDATVGTELSVNVSNLSQNLGNLTYKWYHEGQTTELCKEAKYTLRPDDVGKIINVEVSAANYDMISLQKMI